MEKRARLLALAKLRQATQYPGYTSIADYGGGIYECDFVSPYTKSAGNVDAEVMVVLQDWSSDDELRGGLDDETCRLGYTPTQPTSRNLERLLKCTFGLSIPDIYGTNLFPFIKPGGVSSRIAESDMVAAAREFALPQIEIVNPTLVICLGLVTFNALRDAYGLEPGGNVESAINSPFTVHNRRVWCQAHTGFLGQKKRGEDRVAQDWVRMKDDWKSMTKCDALPIRAR